VAQDDELLAQLREAVEHRTVIGIAIGVVMERLDLERDAAFEHLRTMSSHLNRKLYDIAVDVSAHRRLPGDWSPLR
jgi:AmiR/NasT family two-component response regulator